MTLPLPRCAKCGKSLARKNRWLVETSLPGSPTVGWHMPPYRNCVGTDGLLLAPAAHRGWGELIDTVLKRRGGKQRVRARWLFWSSRKAVR